MKRGKRRRIQSIHTRRQQRRIAPKRPLIIQTHPVRLLLSANIVLRVGLRLLDFKRIQLQLDSLYLLDIQHLRLGQMHSLDIILLGQDGLHHPRFHDSIRFKRHKMILRTSKGSMMSQLDERQLLVSGRSMQCHMALRLRRPILEARAPSSQLP